MRYVCYFCGIQVSDDIPSSFAKTLNLKAVLVCTDCIKRKGLVQTAPKNPWDDD